MLEWVLLLQIVAIIAAIFGFGGIAAAAITFVAKAKQQSPTGARRLQLG